MKARNKLLTQEVTIIIVNMILGVGTIGLPSSLAKTAGPDGIICYLAAVALYFVGTVLIIWLAQRFPNQGLADYSSYLLGSVLGFVFNLVFALYMISVVSAVVRRFAGITKFFLLQRTPLEAIIISMLFAASFLTRNGLEPIARSCQILLYIFFIPFLVTPFFIPVFDLGEFLPLFQSDFVTIAKGAFNAIFALAGIEVMLVLGSHAENPRGLMRPALLGISIVSALILVLIVLAFGSLSVSQTAKLTDPVFEMIKFIPVPFSIFERIDIFIFTVWIASTYSTIVIGLFTASHHLAEMFNLDSGKGFVWPICVAVYFMSLIPGNEFEVAEYSNVLVFMWLFLVYGIVPLLLIISLFRKPPDPGRQKRSSKQKRRKQKKQTRETTGGAVS